MNTNHWVSKVTGKTNEKFSGAARMKGKSQCS